MTTVFQRVGPYEIVREIGRGGMAAVFLADDTRHARQVALKLVPIGQDREAREILEAERWGARLQMQLAEACGLVPRVYEEGDQPPYYFIAMEYVHGENLSDVIARGPVEPGARRHGSRRAVPVPRQPLTGSRPRSTAASSGRSSTAI